MRERDRRREGERKSSVSEDWNAIMKGLPLWPNHFSNTLHTGTITLGIRVSTKWIWGHIQFSSTQLGLPGVSDGKESAWNAGDPGSIPGSGRFPGEGNDNSLQYSSLENSMDKGAWWGPVHGFAKSQTLLSNYYFQLIALFILKYVFVSKCSETFENVAVFEYWILSNIWIIRYYLCLI